MPYLVGTQFTPSGARTVRLPGLPDFNADSYELVVETLDGWDDGAAPVPQLVESGGGAGMVAVGEWLVTADYVTINGSIEADPSQHPELRRVLRAAFASGEAPLVVFEEDGTPLQAFARLYDRRTVESQARVITFSLPLVCPDPFKYALEPLSAEAGGFTASDWFRTYTDDAGWVRLYVNGARFYQETVEDVSVLPKVATLVSPGDATSSRVTFTVTGPLDAGGWWVEDSAGRRLRAEVSLTDGQSVTFDCLNRRAWLDGAPIDHVVYGDFLSLAPGENSYRLVVDETPGAPYMSVEALPAYL